MTEFSVFSILLPFPHPFPLLFLFLSKEGREGKEGGEGKGRGKGKKFFVDNRRLLPAVVDKFKFVLLRC
jgi:hypothetical protein